MRWATRSGCHVDRAGSAWLIRRFIDSEAEFVFVGDGDDIPEGTTPFDVPGTTLSHHGKNCTFETLLDHYRLDDHALQDIGRIVHEADLADEMYDAPEAAGLDVLIRGLSMIQPDDAVLALSTPLFDGLYEFRVRANLLGRIPS